jgi:hypothetical protein
LPLSNNMKAKQTYEKRDDKAERKYDRNSVLLVALSVAIGAVSQTKLGSNRVDRRQFKLSAPTFVDAYIQAHDRGP